MAKAKTTKEKIADYVEKVKEENKEREKIDFGRSGITTFGGKSVK